MQGRRYVGLKSLPAHLKAKARQLLREKWDREAAQRAASRTALLGLLEAMCKVNDKQAVRGFLMAELKLWDGGCPAPTDPEFARWFVPDLREALLQLQAAESIDAFIQTERRRLIAG